MKIRLEVDMLHYIDATPRGRHLNLLIVTHISGNEDSKTLA